MTFYYKRLHLILWICATLLSVPAMAQHSQRITGMVTDKDTHYPLEGVTITDQRGQLQATTDTAGRFQITEVPVGKYILYISRTGYQRQTLYEILVTSAKEVVLNIQMEETGFMQEVVVTGRKQNVHEMAVVSAKTFDIQETERYAGSRADPARMASNFAGVQGADDSRNDIIIRGNSPQGLLWRLEDINIPNPNHFAVAGTTGGPVSMLNNKTLGSSIFLTGAFPAEYGNAVAGAFDLKMRNGNADKYEFTAQLGLLGTELAAEGPISRKNGSSFLVTYRYSTLQLFQGLNIRLGTSSVPNYQDAAFKLHFPVGKKGNIDLFGIGGLSNIDLIVSNLEDASGEIYGESDRDQYFRSNAGVVGASYSHTFNSKTYSKFTIGLTGHYTTAEHEKVFRNADWQVDSLKHILGYAFTTRTTTAHWYLNRRIAAGHVIRVGLINDLYHLDFSDSSRQYPPTLQAWQYRSGYRGQTNLSQAYIQYKFIPVSTITITAGLHGQYLSHNNTHALEPRAGLQWQPGSVGVFSLGYGLHSQTQPLYQYFSHLPQNTSTQMHNYNLEFSRSHHFVTGYGRSLGKDFTIRTEAYYQYLFNVPIEHRTGSSYSSINQGNAFERIFPDTLHNKGTGYNYGLELTISRSFRQGYYLLFTGALYESKARGNDGIYRNTDYNGRFALNLLGGYEKKLGKNSTLITGAKITYAGGRRYSPPDAAASHAYGDFIPLDSLRNTRQFPHYFRADLKLGIRINSQRLTHEIAVDLVNILNTKNIMALTYSPDLADQGKDPFYRTYQLGFLPLFYYRVDFGFGK